MGFASRPGIGLVGLAAFAAAVIAAPTANASVNGVNGIFVQPNPGYVNQQITVTFQADSDKVGDLVYVWMKDPNGKEVLDGTFPLVETPDHHLQATMQFTPTVVGSYYMLINDTNNNVLAPPNLGGAIGDSIAVNAAPTPAPSSGSAGF
ncbi:hypothetical protein AB0I30_29755 [Nocardia tengchongensis]|uniref:hypothetical protein n=1 Tax=Nocardia tengchongensis TaxID=2055889 RepID=UPI0034066BB0